MNQELIISHLESVTFSQIDTEILFYKSDLIALLSERLKEELPKIKDLPMDITLSFTEIKSLDFTDESAQFIILMNVNADKFLLPKVTPISLICQVNFELLNQKIKLQNTIVDINIVSELWANNLLNPFLDKIVQYNQKKIDELILNLFNPILLNINTIKIYLPADFSATYAKILDNSDYKVKSIAILNNQKYIRINSNLSISSHSLEGKDTRICSVLIDKEFIYAEIIAKINEEIKANIEQDVTVNAIQFTSDNSIEIRGQAEYLGIQKKFTMPSKIIFDKQLQRFTLDVEKMVIDGNFLVRNAFSIFEPKLRKQIETQVQIELKDITETLLYTFKIKATKQLYKAEKIDIKLKYLKLNEIGKNLNMEFHFDELGFQILPLLQ